MTTYDLSPLRRHTVERCAMDLLAWLEDHGAANRVEICAALGWPESRFRTALQFAREHIGPQIGLTIPQPVPDDGFCYRVTGEWLSTDGSPAIEAGASYAIGHIEARLRTVYRDVQIAKGNLDAKSLLGRKLNFLDKHLLHLLNTLDEIGGSTEVERVAS